MKKILSILLFCSSINSFTQNLIELDKKSGFKNIKIGNSLSSLSGNVTEHGNEEGAYRIKDISKYIIENHNIDRIVIKITNDGKETIEQISLVFFDPRKRLMKIVNDESQGFEFRSKAAEEIQNLSAKSSEFFFYKDLFDQAFGNSKKVANTDSWIGKKITLSATYYNGDGICVFSSNKPLSIPKKTDEKEAIQASNKFWIN